MRTAVSSTAFRRQTIEDAIRISRDHGFTLEFSSGVRHRPDLAQLYLQADCSKLLHNYFPAPAVPFVLNIASLDDEIWKRSLDHAKQGLRLAAESGAGFYSMHAGFCLDPAPESLGKKLGLQPKHSRKDHWTCFIEAVSALSKEAERLGVDFVVENNVITRFNLLPDGTNPLLCCTSDEILQLVVDVKSDRLGILLDTAHWKVSAETLGFPKHECVRIAPHVRALHHSDNDGKEDTNHPIDAAYWFLEHMPHFSSAMHVLEVHDQDPAAIQAQLALMTEHARK